MSDELRTHTSLAIYLGGNSDIHCYEYSKSRPILTISAWPISLTISAHRDRDPAAALVDARQLLAAAHTYVAECERLAGTPTTDPSAVATHDASLSAEGDASPAAGITPATPPATPTASTEEFPCR